MYFLDILIFISQFEVEELIKIKKEKFIEGKLRESSFLKFQIF